MVFRILIKELTLELEELNKQERKIRVNTFFYQNATSNPLLVKKDKFDKGECLKHQKIQIKINIVASFLMVALVTFIVLFEMKVV